MVELSVLTLLNIYIYIYIYIYIIVTHDYIAPEPGNPETLYNFIIPGQHISQLTGEHTTHIHHVLSRSHFYG